MTPQKRLKEIKDNNWDSWETLGKEDVQWLIRRVQKLENALGKLSKLWLYWPSKRQIEGQPTLYESRSIQEIEDMAKKALEK
jgi:hypothetical protein